MPDRKRRLGRPPLDAGRRQSEKFMVRVSPQLMDDVRAFAGRQHVPVSQLVRLGLRVLLDAPGSVYEGALREAFGQEAVLVSREEPGARRDPLAPATKRGSGREATAP